MPLRKEPGPAFPNGLLAALPREEYARLWPHLELVGLRPGGVLCHAGDAVRHAYFPGDGMICLLSTTEGGRTVEVGMVGSEGMAGVPFILKGGAAPYTLVAPLAGHALRVGGDALRAEFGRGGKLQDLLLRYTHTLLADAAQSAACNRFHTAEERLCRWLLAGRERARADTLHLTQEFLSHMLGVPRTSVTAVAGALRREGLISYGRGRISILDRSRLEAASCECYRRAREAADASPAAEKNLSAMSSFRQTAPANVL